ncbi:NAD(P)/FAD-dependent oxidoreductase [Maridesulfovibrio sp.]|uniref:phytoene desaturase family protein n=1 Tax=Maridesulfovibrio sp. TaxID=2795000 RepID=UPI002A18A6CB|nr:NAD(P)/FAD-dependent oxidoreductase [Maridesulfovibrio sp.]
MTAYNHIVVGAGISGMTSALLLARQGYKVALVESFPLPGPTVRGFSRQGVHFETGIHLIGGMGDGDPLDTYFRHLGINDELVKIPFNEEGCDCFRFEKKNTQICLPYGYERVRRTLEQAFPSEKTAIDTYLERIRTIFDSSAFLNFDLDFSLDSLAHDETESLLEYLDSITDNQDLKDLLCCHSLLYGTPPEQAMLSTHALVAGSYFRSSHTIEGGGKALVDAYQKQLKKHGVDIFCGEKAVRINHDADKNFTGLLLDDGNELRGEICIWSAHPASMLNCVEDGVFRPVFRRRISELLETVSALILFGIAETPVEALQGRNIYLWPESDYSEVLSGRTGMSENAIFLSAGQTLGRDGKQSVTAIMPCSFDKFGKWQKSSLRNRPQGYLDFKAELMAEFAQQVFTRCPELNGQVEFIDAATPLSLRDYCHSPYGSMYGAAHTVSQYNPLPATKIKGLLLAGQSIIAPGVMGAVVSAYLTCGFIYGHEKIHEELKCIYNA